MPDHSSQSATVPPRRRGRPVQIDQETREAMVLDAVGELLLHCRLEDISMSGIARKAGMSKRTLYTIFASREELLGATFARIGQRIFRPLAAHERDLPLVERLNKLMTLNEIPQFEQGAVEVLRAVIAEAPIHPGIARQWDAEGRGALISYISAELAAATGNGEVTLHDLTATEAAEFLVDMVMGETLHELLTPGEARRAGCDAREEKQLRRQRAIRVFLEGIRVR
ncbi:TetR/AcrR family transcriptional regulator [Salipiger bermudensis]|uniref:TetR/AcrR family transcriptional regulator n=1 Tax=Salipiger bermudensis TaxID=344736 RepID=UPI001CD4D026|nr:TetR/AcrR family transcriptional regulator [Salipiger bermudensis]MCA0964561.1 TetR/AcrR family transcriptional regulator [Salipiger bermudensis]